jgi:cytochrome c556
VRGIQRWIPGIALVWSAITVGCAQRTAPEVAPRMTGHFENAGRLYAGVAAGSLDQVRAAGEDLLTRETGEGMPARVRPRIEELRTFTTLAIRAPDVAAAASAVARVGASCGSCHRAMRRGPTYRAVREPPEGEHAVEARMLRHQWAADRLWEALVGPSDESWRAGAETLRDAPLYTDELTKDLAQYEAVTRLAWTVHDIGARAPSVRDLPERASLYADLLATCATCHKLLRQGR